MGGYDPIIMKFIVKENRKYISGKKQITYILTQNGIAIPVHFKFSRVQSLFNTIETFSHSCENNCLLGNKKSILPKF